MPGVERKALKEVESNIPGYANIRIRDVIFQPGASTPMMTRENDMVCETTEGHLEGTKDAQPFTAPKGTAWTCRKGGTEMTTNKGSNRRHHARDRPPPRLRWLPTPATPQGHGPSRGSAETCQWPERPVSHLTKSAQEPT